MTRPEDFFVDGERALENRSRLIELFRGQQLGAQIAETRGDERIVGRQTLLSDG